MVLGFDWAADTEAPQLAVDQAYHGLRELILQQRLRPGDRTSVVTLSERLGLGRTPIKEAITRLASEGLLTVTDRSGTYVREAAPQQIRDLFDVRRLIEGYTALISANRVTEEDLSEIRTLLAAMEEESLNKDRSQRSLSRFVRLDALFHRAIVAAAGNEELVRLFNNMNFELQIAAYLQRNSPEMAERRHKEHSEIVAALERRDGPGLAALLREHADHVEAIVLENMEEW